MEAKELRELINIGQEIPSARCWHAIESQLAATAATVATTATVYKSAAQTIATGTTSTAKIVAITATVATIATVTIGVIIHNTNTQQPTTAATSQPYSSDSILATDSISESTVATMGNEENQPSPTPANAISYAEAVQTIASASGKDTLSPKIDAPTTPTPTATSTFTPPPATLPSPTLSPNIKNSATPISQPSNNMATAQPVLPQKQTPKNITTQEEEDPIATHYNPEENPYYKPTVKIEIPNTITPNGDGYNDYFIITGLEQCDDYLLIILNRDRKEIYRTKNYRNDWGGEQITGNLCYYIFTYKINGIQEQRTGIINIFR